MEYERSSSSESNQEEEEDAEEEEIEEEEEKNNAKNIVQPKKKRRKRSTPGHRRNIKRKYDTVEDLNPEALSAQNEELERIRRLELQQSILSSSHDPENSTEDTPAQANELISSSHVVMVDLTVDDEEDDEEEDKELRDKDAILIGDGSDEESEVNTENKDGAPSVVLSKYDMIDKREDGKVLVNVNHTNDEEAIFLAPQIARLAKPHQIGGIRFMFDNIVESITRYELSDGFGCILAHSMGLGKTLQVIAFIDIFLRYTSAKRVLCIVPVNTLQNWIAEFDIWLPLSGKGQGDNEVYPRSFILFVLSESVKSMENRYDIIMQWYKMGGVLLLGYEMYRLLALSVPSIGGNKMATKKRKSKKESSNGPALIDLDETEREMDNLIEIQNALCRPGPDMVICDEGHRIKNDSTNLSQALKKIRTRRRIVMTGYPLQNNLTEYWCMVDFVRPKYLGTKQEFNDLFERPITNGQCIDSTAGDVRLMKYRSHVLHRLLEGFVMRRGHEILRSVLPPKFEHVILVRSSQVQKILYSINMIQTQEQQSRGTVANIGPLKAFAVCSKIWNHPDIYYEQAKAQKNQTAAASWNILSDEGIHLPPQMTSDSTCKLEWPQSTLYGYETGVLENSPKMLILVAILEFSVASGDRVLIFSQSLSTLSFIEKLLTHRVMPVPYSADVTGSFQMSDNLWIKGKNYFRLDGSTNSSERDRLVCQFNSSDNNSCWAFLLSTKAGCLGINLTGANRVIVVDVSWNPCYDSQAVCRIYRYGQQKPCYIYRLVCDGSMEKRIYDRQVSKQGMADRVVDDLNPERHFTASEILSLLSPLENVSLPRDMSEHAKEYLFDPVLMQLMKKYGPWLTKLPFKHESLLIDSVNEKLTEVEKYVAMKSFQEQLLTIRARLNPTFQHTQVQNIPIQTVHPTPLQNQTQLQNAIQLQHQTQLQNAIQLQHRTQFQNPIQLQHQIQLQPQVQNSTSLQHVVNSGGHNMQPHVINMSHGSQQFVNQHPVASIPVYIQSSSIPNLNVDENGQRNTQAVRDTDKAVEKEMETLTEKKDNKKLEIICIDSDSDSEPCSSTGFHDNNIGESVSLNTSSDTSLHNTTSNSNSNDELLCNISIPDVSCYVSTLPSLASLFVNPLMTYSSLASPLVSVPSQLPSTSVPSQLPSINVPSQLPSTSVPSQLPSTSVPSQLPSTNVPSQLPSTSVPSQLPSTSVPSQLPSTNVPSQLPSTSVPSQLPSTSVPSQLPSTSVPSQLPSTSVPLQLPSNTIVAVPPIQSPVHTHVPITAVVQPVGLPTELKSTSNTMVVSPLRSVQLQNTESDLSSKPQLVSSKEAIVSLPTQSHTPSEAAVANALAGFIQFQKQICKDLNQQQSIDPLSATRVINTLANTLQYVQPVPDNQTTTPNISSRSENVLTSSDTPKQVAVTETSQTSITSSTAPSYSSPLIALMNSLKRGQTSRKAAIVTPISHRPPVTPSSTSTNTAVSSGAISPSISPSINSTTNI